MDSSCAGGSTSQFSKLLCEVSYFVLKTRVFRYSADLFEFP